MNPESSRGRRAASRRVVAAARVLVTIVAMSAVLGGCSWFRKRPPQPATEAPVVAPLAADAGPVLPASATATYCPGYREVFAAALFPRDAVIRGLTQGRAVVRFRIEGDGVSIVSVTASDPAFGDTAAHVVLDYRCHADRPTVIEQSFNFTRDR